MTAVKFFCLLRLQEISGKRSYFSKAVKSNNLKDFVESRKSYEENLSVQRKKWKEEFDKLRAEENQSKIAERRRVTLETAIRNRTRNQDSVRRQELDIKSKEIANRLFREHVEKSQIIRKLRQHSSDKRQEMLKKDLTEESQYWVTRDTIERKINFKLFEKPSTTGLASLVSEHWRYHPISLNLKRVMSEPVLKDYNFTTTVPSQPNQAVFAKKMMVHDFLEPMIGTGADRANYKELVKEFTNRFSEANAFEEYEWYFQNIEIEGSTRQNKDSSSTDDKKTKYKLDLSDDIEEDLK